MVKMVKWKYDSLPQYSMVVGLCRCLFRARWRTIQIKAKPGLNAGRAWERWWPRRRGSGARRRCRRDIAGRVRCRGQNRRSAPWGTTFCFATELKLIQGDSGGRIPWLG